MQKLKTWNNIEMYVIQHGLIIIIKLVLHFNVGTVNSAYNDFAYTELSVIRNWF